MILYVHDRDLYDAGRTFGRHRRLRDVEHLLVDNRTTIPRLAARIIAQVRHRRSIWLLIFNAHGWGGRVAIGTGLDEASVYDLAPVRDYMTPGGRGVEIHACYVASALIDNPCAHQNASCPQRHSVGVEFMRRMAHVLNSPVRASSHAQVGYDSFLGIPQRGADDRGVFEGDMILVQPNGAASLHAPGY